MAKVILEPIGTSIDHMNKQYAINLKKIQFLDKELDKKRNILKKGWGKSYIKYIHSKNKLTVWERIAKLANNKKDIFPIQSFVNYNKTFNNNTTTSPSAGVITAFIKIHNIFVIVIANDNSVAAGAWWPQTPEKIIRAQQIALKLKIPVIYLIDCSGLFLPEQNLSFPGEYGAGHIFKMNSLLSNAGIIQISGVMGGCIAGGGYMPIISDKVFMTEQAYMVIAGTALIKGAKNKNLKSLDIGDANIHVNISNCADIKVINDIDCIHQIRQEIKKIPSSASNFYKDNNSVHSPYFNESLSNFLPIDITQSYDIKQILARIVDNSLFWEIMPEKGQEVLVGIAKIGGLYAGFIANTQHLSLHPNNIHQKRAGSVLYKDGVKKLSIFSRACNDDGLPIIWLQDVAGFDVGQEAEQEGLLGYGSSLIYSNSNNTTPMITVLLRKASGAGYYAMAGLPFNPILQLSTTISRLAVMEGKTLAIGIYNNKIKNNNIKNIQEIKKNMLKIEQKIENDMNPYKAASQMDIDEIIKLDELRSYLTCIIEMCYQNHGTRRIKNPRIWSLHDLLWI